MITCCFKPLPQNPTLTTQNCTSALFFEGRKRQDLYLWASKTPNGPSAKFLVQVGVCGLIQGRDPRHGRFWAITAGQLNASGCLVLPLGRPAAGLSAPVINVYTHTHINLYTHTHISTHT